MTAPNEVVGEVVVKVRACSCREWCSEFTVIGEREYFPPGCQQLGHDEMRKALEELRRPVENGDSE